MAKKYDESTVKTLDALAHIRLSPGCTSAVWEMAPTQMMGSMSCSKKSSTTRSMSSSCAMAIRLRSSSMTRTSQVSVRDCGRGIPLGKVIECVSQINTGAKYNDDVFQFSVGLKRRRNESGQCSFLPFYREELFAMGSSSKLALQEAC